VKIRKIISGSFLLVGILVSQSLFAMEGEQKLDVEEGIDSLSIDSKNHNQIKIVFTGGPCVGKTSLIKAFEKLGYSVIHEVATDLIKGKVVGKKLHPGTDGPDLFQGAVREEQQKRETKAATQTDKSLWFCDRGMPDGAGYYKNSGLMIPKELREAITSFRYDVVFILDPVPYVQDGFERYEDSEEAIKIHNCIREAYEKAGYELITIPNFASTKEIGVRSRMSFVLNKLIELYPNHFLEHEIRVAFPPRKNMGMEVSWYTASACPAKIKSNVKTLRLESFL